MTTKVHGINPARLLSSTGLEQMSKKEGPRRTVYYSKKTSDGYVSPRSSNNSSTMDDKEPLEYQKCST